jgi:hypothetical protein
MAPRLIWKERAEGGRRKGTGNALLLLAITVGSDGHRFDPRGGQPRRCDFPGEVQGTREWTKGFFVKCFVQAQSPWGADVMAPRLIWKERAEGGRRKGTGNALLLLAIT